MKRSIPVRISSGKHAGLVVLHSPEEYERLWHGVDREAAEELAGEDDCNCFHEFAPKPGERGGA